MATAARVERNGVKQTMKCVSAATSRQGHISSFLPADQTRRWSTTSAHCYNVSRHIATFVIPCTYTRLDDRAFPVAGPQL